MIHKVKTVTWEVRSHGHYSALSDKGELTCCPALMRGTAGWSRPYMKKLIWHLQDVLKCMRKIEKEKKEKVYHTIKELKVAGIIRKGEPVIVTPEGAEEKEKANEVTKSQK